MYVFYSTDICGEAEFDIRGDAYKKLMSLCCNYGSVLCLKYLYPGMKAFEYLRDFEIKKPQNITVTPVTGSYYDMRFYQTSPALCDVLLNMADGIFEWLYGWGFKNPDDPTFYRSDGTVFFASEIHEGVCVMVPREGENVKDILSAVKWIPGDPWNRATNLLKSLSTGGQEDGSKPLWGQGDGLREPF